MNDEEGAWDYRPQGLSPFFLLFVPGRLLTQVRTIGSGEALRTFGSYSM